MADREERTFHLPAPPPPPGAAVTHDVLFFRADGPEGGPERDAEDILMRRVPTKTAARFRGAAGGRGLTHGQYLAALVELHERMRALADTENEAVRLELEALGLTTVTV